LEKDDKKEENLEDIVKEFKKKDKDEENNKD
jgi:hypothetical protein